jgi:DNA polymerase-3 subunit alpha
MGVDVLPPDVNHSESGFTVEDQDAAGSAPDADGGVVDPNAPRRAVRFGMLAIKGVGPRPVEEILEARRAGGPFRSLADLCARTDSRALTRGALECLIKAGALDMLGRRSQLLAGIDRAVALGQSIRKMREIGQNSLFGVSDAGDDAGVTAFQLPVVPDHSRQQLLAWEKELLNLYISAHPLAHVAAALKRRTSATTAYLNEEWVGQTVTLGGRIAGVRRIMTKRGDSMAAVQLEDMQGSIEVVVFPRVFEATADRWREDAIVLVTGTVKLREDEPQIVCEAVETLEVSEEELNRREYLLRIRFARTNNDVRDRVRIEELLGVLRKYPGQDRCELEVRNSHWVAHLTPPLDGAGVRFCPELQAQLEAVLGPGTVEAIPSAGVVAVGV